MLTLFYLWPSKTKPPHDIYCTSKSNASQRIAGSTGKSCIGGLANLGLTGINDVRIGKNITLQVEANSSEEAKVIAEDAAKKLLANPVMEMFEVVIG